MRNIRLMDGTVYQIDRAGAADGQLRLRLLPPWDLLEVVAKFKDPEKTAKIEHFFDGTETDHVFFENYIIFSALEIEGENVLIVLKRD